MRAGAFILISTLALGGCASKDANHIGNPLTLPGRAIINGIQNAGYDARRSKVKAYVNDNRLAIYRDIDAGGGSAVQTAMDIARVAPARRPALIAELYANPQIYRQSDLEPLVVAIMVHGD